MHCDIAEQLCMHKSGVVGPSVLAACSIGPGSLLFARILLHCGETSHISSAWHVQGGNVPQWSLQRCILLKGGTGCTSTT